MENKNHNKESYYYKKYNINKLLNSIDVKYIRIISSTINFDMFRCQ